MIKTLSRWILATLLSVSFVAVATAWQEAQQPFQILPGEQEEIRPPIPENSIRITPEAQPEPAIPGTQPLPMRQPTVNASAFEDEEVIMVREQYAGWQAAEAKSIGNRVSNVLRSNWVMADPNGRIEGQVFTVGSATIERFDVFLLQGGRLVTTSRVDENGRFQFTNIVAGAYSLVGIGDNAFFAFGFNAIGYNDQPQAAMPTQLKVTAFQNKTSINLDWIRYFAPKIKFRVFGLYDSEQGEQAPAHLYGFDGIQEFTPEAAPATSVFNHQVKRAEDGSIRGRVRQFNSLHGRPVDLRETKVMLLREDEVVTSTTTDLYGVFEFQNVSSGEYAVVAAGVDGLGCLGVSISDDVGAPADMIDFTMMSSETVGWINQESINLAYDRAIMLPRPKDPKENECLQCGGCLDNCGCQNGYFGQRKRREGLFQKFNRGLNDLFEVIFYPGEQDYQNGQGNGYNYGQPGYSGYPYGQFNDYGYYGQQGYGAYNNVVGNCGNGTCGQPGCSSCNR